MSISHSDHKSHPTETKLEMYKSAYTQLQHSFKNNLNVITELQEKNQKLFEELESFEQHKQQQIEECIKQTQQNHEKELQSMENTFLRQFDLIKQEYQQSLRNLEEEKDKEKLQTMATINRKHEKENKQMKLAYEKQLKKVQQKITEHIQNEARLKEQSKDLENKFNMANLQIVELKAKLQDSHSKKEEFQSISRNYLEELESIKNSKEQWEQILRDKLKQSEKEKTKLQEELTEQTYLAKDKFRKQKDETNRRILRLEEEYASKMRESLREVKETKLKFDSIKNENQTLKMEIDTLNRELSSLRRQLGEKQKQRGESDSFKDLAKTRECEMKILEAEKNRLDNLVAEKIEECKQCKEQLHQEHEKRETAEKALERLKTELLNKVRESEELRQTNKKMKYQIEVNSYNQGRAYDAKKPGLHLYDEKDAIKGEKVQVDYSQCFTDDMGPADERAFLAQSIAMRAQSPQPQSPKRGSMERFENYNESESHQYQNLRAQSDLMKRVGELQNQNNDLKSAIKVIKQEMQRANLVVDEKLSLKDREIKLSKDENFILRERINDKDQQLNMLNENLREARSQLQATKKELKEKKEFELSLQNFTSKIEDLQKQNSTLKQLVQTQKEEIKDLQTERDTLQEISGELKADLDDFQAQIQEYESLFRQIQHNGTSTIKTHEKKTSKNVFNSSKSQYNNSEISSIPPQQNEQYEHQQQFIRPESQKINRKVSKPEPLPKPQSKQRKKLHELIKERKQMEQNVNFHGDVPISGISGRKARIEQRETQEMISHKGTKSQKKFLDRIQSRSKSKERQMKQREQAVKQSNKQISSQIELQAARRQMVAMESQHSIESEGRQRREQESQSPEARHHQQINSGVENFSQLENVSMGFWNS